jgi:plastocyanin
MRLLRLLSVVAAAAMGGSLLLGCVSANPGWTYTPAPPPTEAPSIEASSEPSASASAAGDVQISAAGVAFEQTEVTAPAGQPFTIAFANNDAGVPHNIAIHKDNQGGEEVFKGEIFNGADRRVYDVPALDAGTYAFACSVHPNMVGTLTAD